MRDSAFVRHAIYMHPRGFRALQVWLSLRGPVLLFEMDAGPGLNPFAFLYVKCVKLTDTWQMGGGS